ncbi:hypothetical protein [Phormidium yuhuli]|nr:hypothetical protein [Phormidium yuhuli]
MGRVWSLGDRTPMAVGFDDRRPLLDARCDRTSSVPIPHMSS